MTPLAGAERPLVSAPPAPPTPSDVAATEGRAQLAITTTGLRKVYRGGETAVEGLDLAVRSGEIIGLLGPNGAGKTTTVSMLTTRVLPTAGRAWVGGVDVVAEPARARRRFGVVSQSNTLDRGLSVRENLVLHGRYFGMGARAARETADQWLEAFQLAHKSQARTDELSGGMARRLMLARAMLHGPDVLFLDEPTAGLDPQSRAALWNIVTQLRAGGRTVLLTTHYIEEADEFCDRVAIMDHGTVLALDTPAALKRSLGRARSITVRGDGDLALLAAHLGRIPGATIRILNGSVRLHTDSRVASLGEVIAAAESARFRLTDVAVQEDSLESVFMTLTGRELRE